MPLSAVVMQDMVQLWLQSPWLYSHGRRHCLCTGWQHLISIFYNDMLQPLRLHRFHRCACVHAGLWEFAYRTYAWRARQMLVTACCTAHDAMCRVCRFGNKPQQYFSPAFEKVLKFWLLFLVLCVVVFGPMVGVVGVGLIYGANGSDPEGALKGQTVRTAATYVSPHPQALASPECVQLLCRDEVALRTLGGGAHCAGSIDV